MASEELVMIERVGVGATAFFLVYLLLKETQKRAFAQADKILQLAETTIKENTAALMRMSESLSSHVLQKEKLYDSMKDCRVLRDEKFKEILGELRKD